MTMTQAQRRHLRERIDAARQDQITAIWARKDPALPANVRDAYALIQKLKKITNAYEKQQNVKRVRERDQIVRNATVAMQKVLFSEPDAALSAVIKFESGK